MADTQTAPAPTPNASDSSYLDPMSLADITQAAQNQIGASIAGQVSPLTSQIGTLQGMEGGALSEIGGMFGSIMPYAKAESDAVSASWDQANAAQASIFDAANRQMNQLRQGRAAEAQALAQEMGGPVALGEFTSAVDPDQELLAHTGATQLMHGLMFAQAGEQASRAFSGQVLPLVRTEAEARTRSQYDTQIKQIQDQIAALKGQQGAQVQQRITELMQQERAYALQKAQADQAKLDSDRTYHIQQKTLGLDEKKSERDWKVALNTMKNDNTRTQLAESDTTGSFQGKQTEADKQLQAQIQSMTAQEKNQAAQLKLSNKDYLLRKHALAVSTSYNNKRLAAANKQTANAFLDAAINPQPGKNITVTRAVPVAAAAAISGRIKDAYRDPTNKKTGYSRLVKITQTSTLQPITDPGSLVDYLKAHGVPKKLAVQMVKARLRIPNWTYGEANPYGQTGTGGRSGKQYTRPG